MTYINYLAATLLFVAVCANSAAAARFRLLHSFAGDPNDGDFPSAGVTLSGSTLYGTTVNGGVPNDSGTVFKLNTDGAGYQLLHSFAGGANDGGEPYAGVRLSGSTLYGMTARGGASNRGTVFKLNTDGAGFQLLHAFAGGAKDGQATDAGLTLGGSTLYGTTGQGGPGNYGTVFKLDTDGSGYQLLRGFSGGANDGRIPLAGLTLNGSTLYGTTFRGGPSDDGTVFKLNADGAGFQLLHAFAGGANDGRRPAVAELTLSGSTLYGTTRNGGPSDGGLVFKLNTDGTGFQVLHAFAGGTHDGREPDAGLTLSGSTLYGTTTYGGAINQGTVFKVNTDGAGFQVLHGFVGGTNDGQNPRGRLTLGGSTLYGTTPFGGPGNQGTVYAVTVTDNFAFSGFDEPPSGAANFFPGAGNEELGFVTAQSPTGGLPLVGVATVGAERMLTHRSADAKTTFDAVDLSNWADVEVSVDLQVSNSSFEDGDGVSIHVTNGSQNITLFFQAAVAGADELDNLAGDGFVTFSATIPDDWTTAQLVIESSSNSSLGVERYDFDNIVFSGVAVPVPEPSSLVLAFIGVAAVGRIRSRVQRCRSVR